MGAAGTDGPSSRDSARVLIISGSMGAGKTTVLGETSDLLTARGVPHAAIDLDAVSVSLLPEPLSRELQFRNAASFYQNCSAAGITTFVVAAAIESESLLADLKAAFHVDRILVCRLTASADTMLARLRSREPGIRQAEFLERAIALDAILDAAGTEDYELSNDGRNVTALAEELLSRAGWI